MDCPRVNGFNISVSNKVPVIESQNALDAMHTHRSHKARIVNLDARDAMCHQECAPLFVNCEAVRKQTELFLEKSCPTVRVLRRKAVAIAIYRASTCVPKFPDILGGIAEDAVIPNDGIRR
jgi:hypothetical protein